MLVDLRFQRFSTDKEFTERLADYLGLERKGLNLYFPRRLIDAIKQQPEVLILSKLGLYNKLIFSIKRRCLSCRFEFKFPDRQKFNNAKSFLECLFPSLRLVILTITETLYKFDKKYFADYKVKKIHFEKFVFKHSIKECLFVIQAYPKTKFIETKLVQELINRYFIKSSSFYDDEEIIKPGIEKDPDFQVIKKILIKKGLIREERLTKNGKWIITKDGIVKNYILLKPLKAVKETIIKIDGKNRCIICGKEIETDRLDARFCSKNNGRCRKKFFKIKKQVENHYIKGETESEILEFLKKKNVKDPQSILWYCLEEANLKDYISS